MKTKKGNKKNKSDLIYAKKSKVIERKENPFEVHVNRQKFNVLNQKTAHSFGQPNLSRQKAFEKRKETIGAEFSVRNKSNVFEDKRKAGFKKLPKESIYNLNDSEVLTHRGQTLEEIEQFDDVAPEEDDASDYEESRLDANFTKAHFGGGMEDGIRDRKTVIEELIADSKKRKAERMKEHEEMMDLTNKLDDDWKSLLSVVKEMERTEEEDKPEPDEYDRLVKEMIFCPRGEPTEKLKSEEDLARIEKEKLEKLEQMRIKRMRGEEEDTTAKSNYRSADDLDDGYFLEPVTEDDDADRVLSYPLNPEEAEEENPDVEEEINNEEVIEDDKEVSNDENEGSENEDDNDEEEELEEEESDVDSLDDLKGDDESESESEDEEIQPNEKSTKDLKSEAKTVDPVDQIPFTIELPENYEDLLEMFKDQTIKIQVTIVERIMKTNHPKLHHSNRNKMLKLFAYLLQYINDLFSNSEDSNLSKYFKLVQHLSPLIYDLIQMNPGDCSQSFLEVIKEKYEDYRKNTKQYPKLDSLIFFKIIHSLFPTSDFRHPVVTPTYVFIQHILSQAKVKSRSDISSGLFLATLTLDYQRISKRFLPAVLNFLSGICFLGIKKTMLSKLKPIPPFKIKDDLLVLNEKYSDEFKISDKLKSDDFKNVPIDENFKVRALNVCSNLMRDFIKLYDDLVGMKYFIDPFESVLTRLNDEENLPTDLRQNIQSILDDFKRIRLEKKFKYPTPEKKSIPMLRMLEPRFEAVFSDRRHMYCQSEGANAEKKKLQHMLKRETKAAKRELRKDNEFLSKIKHKRQMKMDRERKDKVKRIFHEANMQQTEYKALSRTKGRKGIF